MGEIANNNLITEAQSVDIDYLQKSSGKAHVWQFSFPKKSCSNNMGCFAFQEHVKNIQYARKEAEQMN